MLKVGMARGDITPPQGLTLEGYPHYPRYNKGAHDPLLCAAMYVANENCEVAIVTLDLLFFSKQHVKKVREIVEERCGIKGTNIMISCSHTHSGPVASGFIDLDSIKSGRTQPLEYVESLINTVAETIITAKESAVDGYFASGVALCGAESGVGGNRRMPGGPHDPLVSVMAIKDTEDVVRGVMVNYTLHPTFIHEWSEVCTADYPCYVKMQIEDVHKDALTGFAQGCSGNQSSRYYRVGESYDEAERVGRTIGKAALTVIEKADWQDTLDIRVANETLELELRDFGTEEEAMARVERDEARYKELYAKYGDSKNRDEYYLWQNANLKMLGSQNQLGYVRVLKAGVKIQMLEDEAPAEVQVIRLGGTVVCGFPGEVFVEYGLYVKGMAGFGTVIFNELANGCLPGYLYTPESLVTGGYETDTSMLGEMFGRHMVDKMLATIDSVK